MRKNIKVLLCFYALIFALSTNSAFAEDLMVKDGDVQYFSGETEFDKIINNGTIHNDSLISVFYELVNNDTIEGENGSIILIDGINNAGSITQKSFQVYEYFENNGLLNITDTLYIANLKNTQNINANYAEFLGTTTNTSLIDVTDFTNKGTLNGEDGKLFVGDGINKGVINQSQFTTGGTFVNNNKATLIAKNITNNGSLTNFGKIGSNTNKAAITNNGFFTNSNNVIASTIENNIDKTFTNNSNVIADSIVNNGDIRGTGQLEFTNAANFGNIEQSEIVIGKGLYQGENASITVNSLTNNANSVIENNKTITINNTLSNIGSIINKGIFNSGATLDNTGTFINSGTKAALEAANITSNNIFGVDNGANVTLKNIDNSNGKIYLTNNGTLNITNQTSPLNGDLIVQNGKNNNFSLSNADFVGNLNIGNANTTLNFNNGSIAKDAIVNIAPQCRLNLTNNSSVILNSGDNVSGDLVLNDNGVVTLDGFKLTTGDTSTQEGGKLAYYEQSGGDLNIINNSTLSMGDSFLIYGGNILVDDNSAYLSRDGGFEVNTFKTSGLLGAMNSGIEDYLMNDMIIGNSLTGKNKADLTIDVYGRSNASHQHATDMFIANNIKEDAGLSSAVINISDWTLAGDIFGWDAPIDRDITLENIFSGNISENVSLTATRKETFTPIGWYQLNNHGGTGGNYTLNLTRFNPQVYRGQVTTLAQWMNQLAIDDMLFNHSMLLPSFKDEDGGMAYSGVMANKYASVDPVFAPYQYSRKDGGLWYKMYGTFETMQMSQGLNNVGNNAYGALIGADFGLRELKNGWKYMPTAYIGYNGAHQYYSGVGAYQNGGQIGFLNTLYKNNFILGGLIYGGVYDNAIDVAGRNDNTFNYFGGAAIKTAYNIRLHRDWVLQPNLFAAYNYFGQQNWHSTYGQMGMMSGMLNGVNIAPGLNLIWEKETFSIYATLQYMYNANGAVGGRAGNVNLPHLCMDRGYIQYGLGFTKRISDRFSGYLQAVLRNVGRTGVGFQMGFNIQLGR